MKKGSLINTFSSYYRKKYGKPVGKVTLQTGFPCPNRAKGGCIFCNPESFRPVSIEDGDSIEIQLDKGKKYLKKLRRTSLYLAYFQQGSATAVPYEVLGEMIEIPLGDPDCIGVILSTRPDCIGEELPSFLGGFHEKFPGKEILVEIGLQSSKPETLKILNRNHTFEDFQNAVTLLKKCDFVQIGVHLIMGIPWENEDDMIATINDVVKMGVNYLKIHHLQVIEGTKLKEIYDREKFKLFNAEDYIDFLLKIIPLIPWEVVIHRLWSDAPQRFLIAPVWNMKSYELMDALVARLHQKGVKQGMEAETDGRT